MLGKVVIIQIANPRGASAAPKLAFMSWALADFSRKAPLHPLRSARKSKPHLTTQSSGGI
jgi:hypothetical protein